MAAIKLKEDINKGIERLARFNKLDNEYIEDITSIIQEILSHKYAIHIAENLPSSSHSPMKEGAHITIGILNRNDVFEIIWSIFHEYGHILQERMTKEEENDPCKTLEREIDAWVNAEVALLSYPKLYLLIDHFRKYRKSRLQSYIKKCIEFTNNNNF